MPCVVALVAYAVSGFPVTVPVGCGCGVSLFACVVVVVVCLCLLMAVSWLSLPLVAGVFLPVVCDSGSAVRRAWSIAVLV